MVTLLTFELLKDCGPKSEEVVDIAEKKNAVGNICDLIRKKKVWPD